MAQPVPDAIRGCGVQMGVLCCVVQVLRGARIVAMTTTGLANQQGLLHGLQPKVSVTAASCQGWFWVANQRGSSAICLLCQFLKPPTALLPRHALHRVHEYPNPASRIHKQIVLPPKCWL